MKNNKKSLSKLGEKNPMWKGDDVGCGKLHEWIKSRLPKPKICPICNEREPIDLANISEIPNKKTYNRDLKNWYYCCRKCHMESDGRLKIFLSNQRKFPKGNQCYKLRIDKKGSEHPASKLNEEKVLEIRKKYKTNKYTLEKLAKEYNVCFQSISLIVNRKIWKHI